MSDEAQATPAKVEPLVKGDVIGHVNGEPIVIGTHVDANMKPLEQAAKPEPSIHEWHAAFVQPHPVTLKIGKRVVNNIVFPEQTQETELPTAKSVVAHRVLHAILSTPSGTRMLDESFSKVEAAKGLDAHTDGATWHAARDKWALHKIAHLESVAEIPEGDLAANLMIEIHAHPEKIAAHHDALKASLASA